MKRFGFLLAALALMLCVVGPVQAASVAFSIGQGTAVSAPDRTATFDSITYKGMDLSAYSEGGLGITTPVVSFVGFHPFNDDTTTQFLYGSGGNHSYVTIKGTDSACMYGVEFKLGSGYSSSTTNLLWETLLNGEQTGSGFQNELAKGTIVGWSDASGFDELRVAASPSFIASSVLGGTVLQAITLDNLNAQFSNQSVPEPSTFALLGMGVIGLMGYGWRRRSQ